MIRRIENDKVTSRGLRNSKRLPGNKPCLDVARSLRPSNESDRPPAQPLTLDIRGVQLARGRGKRTDPTSTSNIVHIWYIRRRSDMHSILPVPSLGNMVLQARLWERSPSFREEHSTLLFASSVQCFPSISHWANGTYTGSENRLHVSGPIDAGVTRWRSRGAGARR
jgi:hypothetical protein